MEAISSLCASTATCAAAAVGYAYGRVDSASGIARVGTESHNDIFSPPLALLKIPLDAPTTPEQTKSLRRPQSLSVTLSGPLWPGLSDEQRREKIQELSDTDDLPDVTSKDSILAGEGTYSNTRASWVQRMSTIAQSHSGSQTSSPRPNTPSPFSNVSSAPFFSHSQVSTPRNKLVKRSTSLRILQSSGYDSSPLTASQNPPLRRPVTSYQRLEQLRIHQRQKDLEGPEADNALETEGKFDAAARHSHQQSNHHFDDPSALWQPYFLVQAVRLTRDVTKHTTVGGKGSKFVESVGYIRTLPRSTPILVRGSQLTKPTRIVVREPHGAAFLKYSPDELDVPQATGDFSAVNPRKVPRSRHSFSFGDIMSTPPSGRKLRRGESLRKPRASEPVVGRRVISAPQRELQAQVTQEKDSRVQPRGGTKPPTQALPTSGQLPEQSSRSSPSPLPPLKRFSAFQIDLPEPESIESPAPADLYSSSPILPGACPADPLDRAGYSSIRIKPRRTSRIPSDRASTAFSSENEHSRVFSTDGDDIDYRSETVYDSIRTDATSSSHSGAKVYRADSVFGGTASPEPPSGNSLSIPDRSLHSTVTGTKIHGTQIAEEDEHMKSPVRVQQPRDVETPTPAQRVFHLIPASSNSSKIMASRTHTGPIGTLPEEDPDPDEFWSDDDKQADWDAEPYRIQNTTELTFRPNNNDAVSRRHVSPDRQITTEIVEYVEQGIEADDEAESGSHLPPFATERGSRSNGRRVPPGLHLRSQSVPLPDTPGHRFNNIAKLDNWVLGGKGVSEDWEGDFEFDEPSHSNMVDVGRSAVTIEGPEISRMLVPPAILERQASVHGQFGHVKQLTQLVEELRMLHESASKHGLLHGQSAELWREAEGIIDLATLDENDAELEEPYSPPPSSVDFDAFDEEPPTLPRSQSSNPAAHETVRAHNESSTSADTAIVSSSPMGSRHGTPQTRPRKESVAKAKHVLENIHQHRKLHEPLRISESGSPRKLPFDTTSLRDLVTRAGVVTRALREIIRRIEDPDHLTVSERGVQTLPEPAFSQIFNQPPTTPTSSRRSPRSTGRRSSGSVLSGSPGASDTDRNGHLPIVSVV